MIVKLQFYLWYAFGSIKYRFSNRISFKDVTEFHISKHDFLGKTTERPFWLCNQHIVKCNVIATMCLTFTLRTIPQII